MRVKLKITHVTQIVAFHPIHQIYKALTAVCVSEMNFRFRCCTSPCRHGAGTHRLLAARPSVLYFLIE